MNQQSLIPMDTGEYLKKRRLEKRISLEQAARAIGMDDKVLNEIELGQADRIAPVYRKGYIQAYARFLEIAEDEIREMVEEADGKDPEIRNIFPNSRKRNPLDRWLRATSYVLASLLIGTLAWQFTHEAVRLSQDGASLQAARERSPDAAAGRETQRPGPVNASIASLDALHGGAAKGLDTAEQAWSALKQTPVPEGESGLRVRVSADSWVEIKDAEGRELEMDLLRGGSEKSYHGKPPFKILLGRASAVRLWVDGESVDLSGFARDDVAQLNWPQAENTKEDGPASD